MEYFIISIVLICISLLSGGIQSGFVSDAVRKNERRLIGRVKIAVWFNLIGIIAITLISFNFFLHTTDTVEKALLAFVLTICVLSLVDLMLAVLSGIENHHTYHKTNTKAILGDVEELLTKLDLQFSTTNFSIQILNSNSRIEIRTSKHLFAYGMIKISYIDYIGDFRDNYNEIIMKLNEIHPPKIHFYSIFNVQEDYAQLVD